MYVNANNMKIYTIEELRNAPIQIRVYSGEQAIKLAYAAGYYTDWKPLNAKYPIYCYLDEQTHPSWNPFPFKNKLTIIEFNQIKNFMENKKIIGYKLIKPEYTKAVCAIEGYICFGENIRDGHVIFLENREEGFKKLQDAKVLDLWFEKVYEKEKQIVKMYSSNKGEFEIEIIDGKAYYRPENKELPKEFIRDIINSFDEIIICSNKKENPYNVTIASLNVGCYHNCKKEDWEKVYKLLK